VQATPDYALLFILAQVSGARDAERSAWGRMWQSYIFGIHRKHGGKMYYDELTGESQEHAVGYFIDHAATTSAWFAWSWLAQMTAALRSMLIRRFRLLAH
jgi:hypothetical protein